MYLLILGKVGASVFRYFGANSDFPNNRGQGASLPEGSENRVFQSSEIRTEPEPLKYQKGAVLFLRTPGTPSENTEFRIELHNFWPEPSPKESELLDHIADVPNKRILGAVGYWFASARAVQEPGVRDPGGVDLYVAHRIPVLPN